MKKAASVINFKFIASFTLEHSKVTLLPESVAIDISPKLRYNRECFSRMTNNRQLKSIKRINHKANDSF